MLRHALVVVVVAVAGCGEPGTAPPDAPLELFPDAGGSWQDLAPMLEPLRAQYGLPGMTVAVVRDGELIALGAVGVRKLGDPTPVEAGDLWHLGSCTKAMTATVLATFVDEGVLSWDTTLAEAFPDLAGTMHPDYAAVTLAQLLSHWGGAWTTLDGHQAAIDALIAPGGTLPAKRATFTELMLAEPPENPPGSAFAYSNAGYIVVGAAMERASGQAWEALMQDRLFTPLGMTCGFGAPGSATTVDQPWGHAVDAGTLTPYFVDNPPSIGPAGTVHCSMAGWGRFLADQSAGDRGEAALVSAASYDRLHQVWPGGDYALGWGVTTRPWAGGTVYNHAGSNTLWLSMVWLAPAIDTSFYGVVNAVAPGDAAALDAAFAQLITDYGL
jgi:CubicO group peptidase (beta-lactamase class C family)